MYQLIRLFSVEYLEWTIAFGDLDLVQGTMYDPGTPLQNDERDENYQPRWSVSMPTLKRTPTECKSAAHILKKNCSVNYVFIQYVVLSYDKLHSQLSIQCDLVFLFQFTITYNFIKVIQ